MKVKLNEQGSFDVIEEIDATESMTDKKIKIDKKVFASLSLQNAEKHLSDAQELVTLWQEIYDKMIVAE